MAVHGGWGGVRGMRGARITTETCYVAGGCVRGGKPPFFNVFSSFSFSLSLVGVFLFSLLYLMILQQGSR